MRLKTDNSNHGSNHDSTYMYRIKTADVHLEYSQNKEVLYVQITKRVGQI